MGLWAKDFYLEAVRLPHPIMGKMNLYLYIHFSKEERSMGFIRFPK